MKNEDQNHVNGEQTFNDYIENARNEFAVFIGENHTVDDHKDLRTKVDSMLIAFDQVVAEYRSHKESFDKMNEQIKSMESNVKIPGDLDVDTVFGYHQALGEFNFVAEHINNINQMIIYNNQMLSRLEAAHNKNRGDVNIQFRIKKLNEQNENHQRALKTLIPLYSEIVNDVWDGVVQKYELDAATFDQFRAKVKPDVASPEVVEDGKPAKMKIQKND